MQQSKIASLLLLISFSTIFATEECTPKTTAGQDLVVGKNYKVKK